MRFIVPILSYAILLNCPQPISENEPYQEVGKRLEDTCIIVTSKLECLTHVTCQLIQAGTSSVGDIVKLLPLLCEFESDKI